MSFSLYVINKFGGCHDPTSAWPCSSGFILFVLFRFFSRWACGCIVMCYCETSTPTPPLTQNESWQPMEKKKTISISLTENIMEMLQKRTRDSHAREMAPVCAISFANETAFPSIKIKLCNLEVINKKWGTCKRGSWWMLRHSISTWLEATRCFDYRFIFDSKRTSAGHPNRD